MTPENTLSHRRLPPEERQQQILEAAARVFARKGYHPATTKEIAQEAGVSEGTLYNYFDSKREMLLSLTTLLVSDTLTDALEQVPADDERAFIAAILRNRFNLIDQNPGLVRVLAQEALQDDTLQTELSRRVIQRAGVKMLAWVGDRIETGAFRAVHPAAAVAVTMSPLLTVGVLGLDQGAPLEELSREALIEELTDLCLNGLRVRETE